MQNLVRIYGENAPLIQKFIISTLNNANIKVLNASLIERLYKAFPSLDRIYKTDEKFTQSSPSIYINHEESKHIGVNRNYLINEAEFQKGSFISAPYVSTRTGILCIRVVYQVEDGYLFLDFKLGRILERLDLIEKNDLFKKVHQFSYSIIGGGMLFFGVFVVLYGFYSFIEALLGASALTIDVVFKPIIALTLGLAVYDLGKTIFEQEVLPKTQHISDAFNAKTLLNFSVSIIIALLIEALLVVFKISIQNYKDLPYAATLIAALAFLLLVFSVFIYLVRKSEVKN